MHIQYYSVCSSYQHRGFAMRPLEGSRWVAHMQVLPAVVLTNIDHISKMSTLQRMKCRSCVSAKIAWYICVYGGTLEPLALNVNMTLIRGAAAMDRRADFNRDGDRETKWYGSTALWNVVEPFHSLLWEWAHHEAIKNGRHAHKPVMRYLFQTLLRFEVHFDQEDHTKNGIWLLEKAAHPLPMWNRFGSSLTLKCQLNMGTESY